MHLPADKSVGCCDRSRHDTDTQTSMTHERAFNRCQHRGLGGARISQRSLGIGIENVQMATDRLGL